MWLLSTNRAELHFFASPESVTGGYAILSHTWGHGNEQTFQEIQALRERCVASGENPRDFASSKIQQSCILAESHGYQWLWVDSCCIDKTSSTELSEAINSMFRWYSLAEVCFAYLEDVERECDLHAAGSSFRTARWHSRGWTLQELIAPMLVIFVSQDWNVIGNKVELAPLLQQITGIWRQVLTREVHYSVISVAQRMSWAANRNTTRVEDEAYCLVGLFNVNMPTIYGEGRQAFQRLQHEIMKQSIDTSLFAWGLGIGPEASVTPMGPQEIYQYFNTASQNHVYLLADSPRNFVKPFGLIVRFTPSATHPLQPYLDWQRNASTGDPKMNPKASVSKGLGPFGRMELPKFSITSYGLECRFPIIESGGLTVAVLLCDNNREHIGLLLHPSNVLLQDPSRKKYHVGLGFRTPSGDVAFARLISLGNDFYNLRLGGKPVTAEWRDVFIADSPPPIMQDVAPSLCYPLHCLAPAPPFRIPHWLIGRLAQLGMQLRPLQIRSRPAGGKPLELSATFENVCAREGIRLILGTCAQLQSQSLSAHWAKAMPQSSANWGQKTDFGHDCREHHVEVWPGWTKDFGDVERTVRLSFSPCRLTPEHTFVVHVELEGKAYDAMKGGKNVEFPTREGSGLRINVVESGKLSLAPAGPTDGSS